MTAAMATVAALGGARPGPLDRLDLLLLQAAKRRRRRYGDSPEFYEEFFLAADVEKYAKDIRSQWRCQLVRRAFDAACPDRAGQVVDIGCGLAMSFGCLPSGVSYVGVDPSVRTLELARTIHGRGPDLRPGGFPRLPVAGEAASFAICLEVLEHVSDDVSAVYEIARILRRGGHVLLSVPSTFYWPQYLGLIGHYRHYAAEELERTLASTGLEVVARYSELRALWRSYHYCYVASRGVESLVRRRAPAFSLYDSRVYQRVANAALRYAERHTSDHVPASTIVLCRREA